MAQKKTTKNDVIRSQGKATDKDFKPGGFGSESKSDKPSVPASKNRLGKGLDALISNKIISDSAETKDQNVSRETSKLNINLIDPNPNQPRKSFDEDSLNELAASIREHGLIQPIVVQKSGDRYIIVAGERRWRASKIAELKEVPVYIRDFTPQELFEAALIENIQRQDLNPIEEAEAYNLLIREYKLKQDEVAERVSKSRVAITNSLRLLNLEEKVRELVVGGMLSGGHARALLAIKDPALQYRTALKVFDESLSVRDTEKLVKKTIKPQTKKKESVSSVYDASLIKKLEDNMRRNLGSKVSILQKDGKKGNIVIEYYSSDDLNRLYELLINAR